MARQKVLPIYIWGVIFYFLKVKKHVSCTIYIRYNKFRLEYIQTQAFGEFCKLQVLLCKVIIFR